MPYSKLASNIVFYPRHNARALIGSDCGAAFMEECPPGCEACVITFRHVPQSLLYNAESDIAGQGLFTDIPIAKGMMIMPFIGRKWKPKSSTESNGYALQVDSRTWISPNGIHRFVNHSCEPNAGFIKWTNHKKSPMVSIVALKNIARGAEICANYGEHHDLSTGCKTCRCNAPSCVTKNKKRKRKPS